MEFGQGVSFVAPRRLSWMFLRTFTIVSIDQRFDSNVLESIVVHFNGKDRDEQITSIFLM